MRKRSAYLILLVAALLLSAWSNVIAAAFCPRYLARNCPLPHATKEFKQVEDQSCHHEMTDLGTGDMSNMQMDVDAPAESEAINVSESSQVAVATESSMEQTAVNIPTEPCGHCWMHSQPSSGTGTLAAVNPSPQPAEAIAPAEMTVALDFPNPSAIEPLEHGPPGNSFPRHILINVFRI